MIGLYSTVMRAIDPRLQIGEDKMDHGQVLLCLIRIATERKRAMSISDFIKSSITPPSVSANDRARRYGVFDESGKRIAIAPGNVRVGDNAEPEASSIGSSPSRTAVLNARPNFNSANDSRLMVNATTFAARSAANVALVYFDRMRRANGVAIWPHHASAELMEHGESSFVGGDTKLALKLNCRLAGRLRGHEVCAPKPSREWHMAGLHDRPSRQRCVFLAGTATQHNRRARGKTVWLADNAALLASEAIGPADRFQIASASVVIGEDALKFREAGWERCVHA
jgi:hypothetical protein